MQIESFPRRIVVEVTATALLLSFLPYAVTRRPLAGIVVDGVWKFTYLRDPAYPFRAGAIVAALVIAAAGSLFALASLALTRRTPDVVACKVSLLLAVLTLGWRSMPYWLNGVGYGELTGGPTPDLDPKALPPMIWLGETWRLSVLLLYPLGVALVVIAARALAKARRQAPAVLATRVTVFSVGVVVLSFVLSPGFVGWLLD